MAVLQDEPAGPRVRDVIAERDARISWINLGEVYCELIKREVREEADRGISVILSNLRAEEPDSALVRSAARLKARGGISYADCFALATAQRHRAPLYTGDPEIVAFGADVEVVDLRAAR